MEWWLLAAKHNQVEAFLNIAHMYYSGCESSDFHLAPNPEMALHFWLSAANRDDCRGLYMVGAAYEHGVGCAINVERAQEYYIKALTRSRISQETEGPETHEDIRYHSFQRLLELDVGPIDVLLLLAAGPLAENFDDTE